MNIKIGTKEYPIETNNNIFIIDTLKTNTYFRFKCISCGKIIVSFFDKRHIDLYKTMKCRSCRQSIDKTQIGQTPNNPFIIHSQNDFNVFNLKYGNYIKYNCVKCNKEVIREWRPNRDSVCRKMLCEQCSIEQTSLDIYGTRRPQQSDKLRKYNSDYMKSHPEIIKNSLESQRLHNNGMLYLQTEKGKLEQHNRSIAHPEWNKKSMESNRNNHNGLHNMQTVEGKEKCIESNKNNHGGLFHTQTDRFKEIMRKLFEDDPEKCYFNTDEWKVLRQNHWSDWRPSKYYFQTDEFQKLRIANINNWRPLKYGGLNLYNRNGLSFDSKWELEYYIYCIDHGINIIREPTTINYKFDGKIHCYSPDFLVDGKLVEIKGDHFFKSDGSMYMPFRKKNWSDEDYEYYCKLYEAKHQCMIDNNVVIIRKSGINKIEDYINHTYGKNFCDNFKIKRCTNHYNRFVNLVHFGYTPYDIDYNSEYQKSTSVGKTPFD